jgi:signal transduction histidine kinase
MGLGLSLAHHIVENHRGVVWAESENEKGADFLVWLPRCPVARAEGQADLV